VALRLFDVADAPSLAYYGKADRRSWEALEGMLCETFGPP
jgi:hypothetical protein